MESSNYLRVHQLSHRRGPVARVFYRSANEDDIWELRKAFSTSGWQPNDLTTLTGAQKARGNVFAYTTNLTGEGAVARVMYITYNYDIEELSLRPAEAST
jgi:hypothetical protein